MGMRKMEKREALNKIREIRNVNERAKRQMEALVEFCTAMGGEVKEVKIRPKIESHDLEVKMKNVFRFLSSGNKVKLSIIFSGREISYKDFGKELLKNILNDVKNKFSVDLSLFNENRYIGAMITPKSETRRERDAKNENS